MVLVVGLDPGGAKAFGWAVVAGSFDAPSFVAGGVCSGARAAIEEVSLVVGAGPDALGIDAPLFWSPSGDRRADDHVRKLVCRAGGSSGTVSHVNSLRGACLVEGAIAAHLANARWPKISITEAHPKALLAASEELSAFAALPELQGDGHHLRDAALGALTAMAMLEQRSTWQDLSLLEPQVLLPLGTAAQYWFPRPNQSLEPTRVGKPPLVAQLQR